MVQPTRKHTRERAWLGSSLIACLIALMPTTTSGEALDFLSNCPRAPNLVHALGQRGVRLEFFPVAGESVSAILRDLNRGGPVDTFKKRRWALFSWSVVGNKAVGLRHSANLRFPCLVSRGVLPRVRRWWFQTSRELARHEAIHVAIDQRLQEELSTLDLDLSRPGLERPSTSESRLQAVVQNALFRHQELDAAK